MPESAGYSMKCALLWALVSAALVLSVGCGGEDRDRPDDRQREDAHLRMQECIERFGLNANETIGRYCAAWAEGDIERAERILADAAEAKRQAEDALTPEPDPRDANGDGIVSDEEDAYVECASRYPSESQIEEALDACGPPPGG
jgi:hypothetical protein